MFKRKHFMQTTKHDCGVACIYTLLTYYNCHVDYNKIRNYFKNDYSGINISQIDDFFQLFNIKIKLYKNTYNEYNGDISFDKKMFPCIALLQKEFNEKHYIVIYSIKNGKVVYSDPEKTSLEKVHYTKISKQITYYILPQLPDKIKIPIEFIDDIKNNFIYQSIYAEKKYIILSAILSFFVSLLGIFLAMRLGFFLGFVENKAEDRIIFIFGIIILIFIFIERTITYIKNVLSIKVSKRIEYNLRLQMVKNLLMQDISRIEQLKTGDINARINDCLNLSLSVSTLLLTILSDLFIAIVGLIVLFNINLKLEVYIIFVIIINIFILQNFLKKIYKKNYVAMKDYSYYNGSIVEIIDAIRDIKSLHNEKYRLTKNEEKLILYKNSSFNKDVYNNKISIIQTTLFLIANVSTLVFGSIMSINGEISTSELMIYISILNILQSSCINILMFKLNLENFRVGYNRILHLFDLEIINDVSDKEDFRYEKINNIILKNVSIKYDDVYILKNINFCIDKQFTFFVGSSGAGKSTLARIISTLQDNYEGEILYNGEKLNMKNTKLIRTIKNRIIYVSNNSKIFNCSIRENLCSDYLINEVTLEKICKDFCILDFINSLPRRFDTIISPNQNNLSSGQIQRLALIRAVLLNPDFLILDEALSNVDKRSLKNIINILPKYIKHIIFITHEDYNIEKSDTIYIDQYISK
ncbi:ABC transporter transmembrane domain-containing protein [Faecalibacillus intestinalis]|uniref:ABC transporter transmembrane domain-containing protein n=1 Tax=Faecalibacillus intestinalis TaxID=1982626 RepID=A0AAP2XN00_9FIRM|nr:ABC transporter transmembrane domain-containing protein [Faecalibacillus intestinalis]MCB8592272.1 ATP-binding cassette domain-containing protein [Faecalibacillus intestinalis]MCB8612216.1 ATP-binding cassette domain-containing protein [Faecalibacillus intestinalis]MCG4680861.1 ATP-binding cassette domain-containing protein [Faecalibacillus intestinalis]MCG4713593.1 ATP-binding cassette domain-containing protein [Faecalibacillus intestinalis]MCG4754950.1 ATP-binding cassette domain-containi